MLKSKLSGVTGHEHETIVQGVKYLYCSDFNMRATYAMNIESGEIKKISSNGYINNDLTVRKAIANIFGLKSFRK